VKVISVFDKAVIEAGDYNSPKEVARYAYRLCSLFNEFYESVQVNSEQDPGLKAARLALVDGFSAVLKEALSLTGIETSEKI
jgi:arginyl-tRNA synthetase